MNNRKIKIGLRIYEFALILNVLLIFPGIKTKALVVTGCISLAVFILHWFLPNEYKRVLFALTAGFLSWFFWLHIVNVLMLHFNLINRYQEHSLWDLFELAAPSMLALTYGIWALVKRETEKINDRVYMGCLSVVFFMAAVLDA